MNADPTLPPAGRVLEEVVPDELWRVAGDDGARWWKRVVVPAALRPLTVGRRSRSAREAAALRLMRERGVPAVRPLAVHERHVGPFLVASALVTEEVPRAVSLSAWLRSDPDDSARAAALEALGRLAAGLHRAGLAHFRLLPKNVVLAPARPDRLVLLDAPYLLAWDGTPPDRCRAFDLATLGSAAAGLGRDAVEAVLAAYDAVLPLPAPPSSLVAAPRGRLKRRRIALYLGALWTGHRPERFLAAS